MHRQRLVAQRDDLVVGWGEVGHMWWAYHPHKFMLRLNVDPLYQQQGIGSRLYVPLAATLAGWSPTLVRTETRETRPHSVAFLTHRGFAETRRRWESRLDLSNAHVERYAGAYERLARQGIAIVTLVDEKARHGEHALHDLFDLEQSAWRDEPGFDPEVAMQFAQFVSNEFDSAEALDDGTFLAVAGQRLVGVSRLQRNAAEPQLLEVGFTGIHPAYRGRGIAVALKLRTVEYGRAHGFQVIRTQNDVANAAMLHINAALGFQQEPPWLVFEKRLA
jgi:GNAT superfamily N-acetyltransferase